MLMSWICWRAAVDGGGLKIEWRREDEWEGAVEDDLGSG